MLGRLRFRLLLPTLAFVPTLFVTALPLRIALYVAGSLALSELVMRVIVRPLSLSIVETEERLRHMALQDPLTGLANRPSVMQRLAAAQARRKRSGTLYGVLYVDLDAFKPVNDTYGHAVGDLVLQELAYRMTRCVRGEDTVARLGGDEFVVCLEDLGTDFSKARAQAIAAARRLHHALASPVVASGVEVQVGASIGVAIPKQAQSPEKLLDIGDQAMYQAKGSHQEFYVVAE